VAAGELGRGSAGAEGRPVMSTDLHERTLSIETQPLDNDRVAVHAELRDLRHVQMCAERLTSLSVGKGFTSAALARVAGPTGCAHLAALVIALTPTIPQASGALAGLLKLRPDQRLRKGVLDLQVDS
jgi:hypothetical protein